MIPRIAEFWNVIEGEPPENKEAIALPRGSANPSNRNPKNVPPILTNKTGRRPYRSESRPKIGAAINWAAE
jgi:hypothetical protein